MSYAQKNYRSSEHYRQFNEEIPSYLHNRPHAIVQQLCNTWSSFLLHSSRHQRGRPEQIWSVQWTSPQYLVRSTHWITREATIMPVLGIHFFKPGLQTLLCNLQKHYHVLGRSHTRLSRQSIHDLGHGRHLPASRQCCSCPTYKQRHWYLKTDISGQHYTAAQCIWEI